MYRPVFHSSAFTISPGARSRRIAHLVTIAIWLPLMTLTLWGCGPSVPEGACAEGELSCPEGCVDLLTDSRNCGACGLVCEAGFSCSEGACMPGGGGDCEPGATETCYTGPVGTEGIGVCRSGTRTCPQSAVWGPCEGEVTPVTELCLNGVDDNCNGVVDDETDTDLDGFTNCGGDCCDAAGEGCANPELVNPGAFEVLGNTVDDDCDGVVDNALVACDTGLASNSSNPDDYAAALDLCQTAGPDGDRWGLISARFALADGSGTPDANSRSIRPDFGATGSRFGDSLVVLSTGHAADVNDTNPSFAEFQTGQDMFTTSSVPSDWYAANGNNIPNAPGCPEPLGGGIVNDPVMYEMQMRVPSNARSFSMDINFFSAEYPEWTCSPYNDFFVVLLDSAYSGDPANPADKNLARYTSPDMSEYPVGVNLAFGDTGLFQICENGQVGCSDSVQGTISTCTSVAEMSGTGMDIQSTGCGANDLVGGGTGWLTTSGNVVPGETITLRIAIWDTSDHVYDSVVLLDNFQWSVDASDPGTVIIID